MSSFSPRPSSGARVSNSPQNLGGRRLEAPRLSERKGGYQVGLQSSLTGSRNRVSVVNSSPGTFSTTSSAASLDGARSFSITDVLQNGLDLSEAFTLEMWYFSDVLGVSQQRNLVSKTDSSGGYQLFYTSTGGEAFLSLRLRQSSGLIGTTNFNQQSVLHCKHGSPLKSWNHLAITYQSTGTNAGTISAYTQGHNMVNTSIAIGTIGNGTATFFVGANSSGGSILNGGIKELRVWNNARSGAQILADMRNDNPTGTGLVGYWKFDGNSNDSSGNGNNLTANGVATYTTDLPFGTVYGVTQRYSMFSDGDGYIQGTANSQAGARGAANGTVIDNTGNYGTIQSQRIGIPLTFRFARGFMPFDVGTSGLLPARGGQLMFVSGTGVSVGTAGTVAQYGLVETTQANTGTLVASDYSQITLNSPTELASRIHTLGTNVWNSFLLNSNGVNLLENSYGGSVKVGIRDWRDIDNPTIAGDTNIHTAFTTSRSGPGPFLDIIV